MAKGTKPCTIPSSERDLQEAWPDPSPALVTHGAEPAGSGLEFLRTDQDLSGKPFSPL